MEKRFACDLDEQCTECEVCEYLEWIEWAQQVVPPGSRIERNEKIEQYLRDNGI